MNTPKCLLGASECILQSALVAIMLAAMPAHAAPFAYVTNVDSNTVSVIDSATNTVVATVPVGLYPTSIAVTPDGQFAYVANENSDSVTVIATATNTVVDTVVVKYGPVGVAVTPDGKFAYVSTADLGGRIAVIATATNTVVSSINIGETPGFIAFTPNGAFAYVVNLSSASVSVIATASHTVVATIGVGDLPDEIAITPNGSFAYVASVGSPESGSGTVSIIATATNMVVDTIAFPTGFFADFIAISPNGELAYVTSDSGGGAPFTGELVVLATATNKPVASLSITGGAGEVAFTPNGEFAYVLNSNASSISVVSTSTDAVVATITYAGGPNRVGFAPSPALLSAVPNPASGLSNAFALTYSDVYGASDLGFLGVMFDSQVTVANSCNVFYAPSPNQVYLLNDAGTGSSSLTPGSGTLSNSQCTISGSGTSVVKSGNNLTLNVAVTASSTYTGKHNIFLLAEDNRAAKTGWVNQGTWTPTPNQPPTVGPVTPNRASGLTNTFVLPYSDLNGASDLAIVGVIFNSSASAANSCEVLYSPAANLLYLLNDAGTGSSRITPGSGTLSNSQCTIAGSGTSVVRSGATLTLNLDVTASATYTGAQNVFLFADDNSAANTNWVNEGTWTP